MLWSTSIHVDHVAYLWTLITSNVGQCICSARTCRYGGEEEFYVETRETGALEQNKIKQNIRKSVEEDWWSNTMLYVIYYFSCLKSIFPSYHMCMHVLKHGKRIIHKWRHMPIALLQDDSGDMEDANIDRLRSDIVRHDSKRSAALQTTSEASGSPLSTVHLVNNTPVLV